MGHLKVEVPIPVRTLGEAEIVRAKYLASKITYPVNIELMQINCPFDSLDEALKNKHVITLCRYYKFSLQSTIV